MAYQIINGVPTKTCKHCSKVFTDPRLKLGNVCIDCTHLYKRGIYKRRQARQISVDAMRKREATALSKCGGMTPAQSFIWIEKILYQKGWCELPDISMLIDVYYCLGGMDQIIDSKSMDEQLAYMWQYSQIKYRMAKNEF